MFLTRLEVPLAIVLAFFLLVLGKVALNLVSKEIEGRLDQLPSVILKVARRRLPAELRQPMHDEWWLPDLRERLAREDSRPITRLIKGLCFAVGLVVGAGRTARAAGVPSLWRRLWRRAFPALRKKESPLSMMRAIVIGSMVGGLAFPAQQVMVDWGWITPRMGLALGCTFGLVVVVWLRLRGRRRGAAGSGGDGND